MRDWEILLIAIGGWSVFWVLLGYLAPKLGPWGRLVARYPANGWTPTVFKARFVSMSCLWFSYGNCLTIEFGDDTMTVRMGALCLPFHAPFTVPKSAIHHLRRGRFVFIPWMTFCVEDCQFLLWGPDTRTAFFDGLENTG